MATLQDSSVPGSGGQGSTVFYASDLPPEQIYDTIARELPAKGWTIVESSPEPPYRLIAAQGHGFVALFGVGTGFGPSQLPSGQKIAFQVTIAQESAASPSE